MISIGEKEWVIFLCFFVINFYCKWCTNMLFFKFWWCYGGVITKKDEIIDTVTTTTKFHFLCNIELEISIWNTRSHNFIFGNCSSLCFWISFVALSVYLMQLQTIWRERAAAFSLGFKRYRRFTYIVVLAHINPYLYMADAKFK